MNDVFKYFGWATIVLGVIAGFIAFADDFPFLTSFLIIFGSVSFGLLFIGFGAMLHSLQRIELKVAGEEPPFVSNEESSALLEKVNQ